MLAKEFGWTLEEIYEQPYLGVQELMLVHSTVQKEQERRAKKQQAKAKGGKGRRK